MMVTRYKVSLIGPHATFHGMEKNDEGKWVLYDDYNVLRAEIEALQQAANEAAQALAQNPLSLRNYELG